MAVVYLGANQAFSGSGVVSQGTLDYTSGANDGTALACPGVFPINIRARFRVRGSGTLVNDSVLAASNSVVLRGIVHDDVPSAGGRIRLETRQPTYKIAGGRYVSPYSTVAPVGPYLPLVGTGTGTSISLTGLPSELYLRTNPATDTSTPAPTSPSDPSNLHQWTSSFTHSFPSQNMADGVNMMWSGGGGVLPVMSINLSGQSSNLYFRGTTGTDLRGAGNVQIKKYPVYSVTNIVDEQISGTTSTRTDAQYHTAATLMAQVELTTGLLPCFNTTPPNDFNGFDLRTSVFGTASAASPYVKKLAFYKSETVAGAYTFAAIQESAGGSYAAIGMFSTPQNSPRARFFDVHYFRGNANSAQNASIEGAGIKPAFGVNSAFTSSKSNGTLTRSFWADMFPTGERKNQYSDVVSTQYGFVFLNKNTKHLEYMFRPHYDPGYVSSAAQVVNKLIHPPPRSADYIPAANMALGADLASTNAGTPNGYLADSIYKAAANTTAFNSDHVLHGGGGHVMALGTYNGAIVSGGKIAVWGSNRWGQCVVPSQVAGLSSAIVDVAVSNAPPALAGYRESGDADPGDQTFYTHSVYSDELAEFLARDLRSYTQDLTDGSGSDGEIYNFYDSLFYNLNSYYMSYHYPTISSSSANNIRYAGHINFTNLPGHVLVVTDTGWVYAWGNNKYNQCSVPAEINLLDASGNVKTAPNPDPVMEVSAGAFHSLARSKSGVLYAWGAGNHTIVSTQDGVTYPGYLVGSTSAVTPFLNGTEAAVRQSVHFAQCVIQATTPAPTGTSYYGFAIPSATPPGTTSPTADTYAAFSPIAAANVVAISNNAGTVVGQKSPTNFCAHEQGVAGIRCKGYIAAGAFHTAIVDRQFKIQCIGAGRGPVSNALNIGTIFQSHDATLDNSTLPHWGSSYSNGDGLSTFPSLPDHDPSIFGSYPHYCQSMSQYRAPWPTPLESSGVPVTSTPDLFRSATDATPATKDKYFQDLRFKKVVCGPFSTHGIVYDVSRTTGLYSLNDRIEMHGRVVSWGSVYGTRTAMKFATGPTGICQVMARDDFTWKKYNPLPNNAANVNGLLLYNPAGVVSGTGSIGFLRGSFDPTTLETYPNTASYVSRSFELLNRSNSLTFTYSNPASLLNNIGHTFVTGAPVTISKFKVKDMASCGDYSIYAGYIDTLTQSSTKPYPGQAENSTDADFNNSGASFDYQSSVFFTGPDYYYSGTVEDDNSFSGVAYNGDNAALVTNMYGRMYANNPYSSAGRLTRSNRVNTPWLWNNSTGVKLNTKSLYFGEIKQPSGITNPSIGTTAVSISYVNATTVLASNNMVCAVVGMDNRPTAWSCYFQPRRTFVGGSTQWLNYYSSPIDLTLIPSVPFKEIKAGKSHILAVSDGDWPIAKSLSNLLPAGTQALQAQTPKLVTELGTRLFAATPASEIPVKLISATTAGTVDHQFGRPVLLAFGAGDGREYGTSLLGYPFGFRGVPTYGSWFLDTHAITRYDSTASAPAQSLSVGADAWENYYGHYRWNLHSTIDGTYTAPSFQNSLSTNFVVINLLEGGFPNPSSSETTLPTGHHLCESMQSMLQFQPDQYPASFTNPALTGRTLLNGTMMAGIPVGVYRPWVSFSSLQSGQGLNRTVCCATAAEEAQSNYASLNTQLEYHSPLNFARQSYTDYVVDYAAGSLHSAILFSSACPDYSVIQSSSHLNSLSNFRQQFMSGPNGEIHFGQRRICKLGIVGYGCENQTAGRERKLSDGMAPIVPMLFSRSAKVYCGESYTLVTDPVRVVHAQSAATSLTFVAGTTVSTCTVPITIPAARFSKRLRGFDVTLTFSHAATGGDVPLSDLTFKLPYRRSTFVLLDRVRAGANPAYLRVNEGASVSIKISDRFSPSKAYSYSDNPLDVYSEAGLNPADLSSYVQSSTNFYINGLNLAATIPALSKQGCYYPVSVNPTTFAVTESTWDLAPITVPKFDQATVNVVIEDITNTDHSYAGYTVTATIEAEVDASDVPYVIFGPTRSGAWNEIPGLGPSYVADIGDFRSPPQPDQPSGTYPNIESVSCPCEAQTIQIFDRKYPKSFISDSSFVCGTKKYGPLGNRENQAAYVTEEYIQPASPNLSRDPLLKNPRITANFFSVFTVVPHRPAESLNEQVYDLGVTMHSLPSAAFLVTGQTYFLSDADIQDIGLKFNAVNPANTYAFLVGLRTPTVATPAKLSINSPTLYNKAFFPPNINMSFNVLGRTAVTNPVLNLIVGMRSDICN